MNLVRETLAKVRVGDPVQHLNLSWFPLNLETVAPPDYLTLDDASAAGVCKITEVSESARVSELAFENLSPKPVLLLDGEELAGAKQNGVLNLSILVAGQLKLTIPVSCVEQGRWRYRSARFASGKRAMFAKGRAAKMRSVSDSLDLDTADLRTARESDQGEIWNDISDKMRRLNCRSETMAACELHEAHRPSLSAFIEQLAPTEHQAGAVFAIDGEIAGVELLDAPATFAKLSAKLVESYALDAIDVTEPRLKPVAKTSVFAFFASLQLAELKSFKALGMGQDLRLRSGEVIGAGLEAEGRLVHFSAFKTPAAQSDTAH